MTIIKPKHVRTLTAFTALVLLLYLTACGNQTTNNQDFDTEDTSNQKAQNWESDWQPVTTVAKDVSLLIALRADGTIRVVSNSMHDIPSIDTYTTVPIGLTDIVSVNAWRGRLIALDKRGSLTTWGNPQVAPLFDNINNISSMHESWRSLTFIHLDNSLSVLEGGSLTTYATNQYVVTLAKGRSFLTDTHSLYQYESINDGTPVKVLDDVKGFTAGYNGLADLAILQDGSVVDLGNNEAFMHLSKYDDYIKIVSTGTRGRSQYLLGLRSNGDIVTWANSGSDIPNPYKVNLKNIVDIVAQGGGCFTALNADGEVLNWGWCLNFRNASSELNH